MNPEHWQKIKGLLDDAMKLDAQKREQFLDDVCGNNLKLRREVEELLASSENVKSFLEKPVVGEVAEVIVNREDKLTGGQSFGHYKVLLNKLAKAEWARFIWLKTRNFIVKSH